MLRVCRTRKGGGEAQAGARAAFAFTSVGVRSLSFFARSSTQNFESALPVTSLVCTPSLAHSRVTTVTSRYTSVQPWRGYSFNKSRCDNFHHFKRRSHSNYVLDARRAQRP